MLRRNTTLSPMFTDTAAPDSKQLPARSLLSQC